MRHSEIPKEPATSDGAGFGCTTGGDDLLAIGQALRVAVGDRFVERARTPGGLVLRIARHPGAAAALRDCS